MSNDMSSVITPRSDQWNYDDFQTGPKTFTITGVKVKTGQEQPVEISLEGTPKFYRPCKSMARVIVAAWGADSSKYTGRSLTLYGDASVKWGGMAVGGIRISHMSHIDESMTMALTVTRANKKPYTVKVLSVAKNAAPQSHPVSGALPAADSAGAAPNEAMQPKPENNIISAAQHKRLEARINEVKASRDDMKAYVKKTWGVEHLNELTQEQYNVIDAMLDKKAAKLADKPAQSDGGIIGMKDDMP